MAPASIVGVLFLWALVPGFVALSGTAKYRRAAINRTTIEESLTLIAFGLGITGPVGLVIALAAPDTVAEQLGTLDDPSSANADDIVAVARLAGIGLMASLALALLIVFGYWLRGTERSSDSTWLAALHRGRAAESSYLEAELTTGRVVRGQFWSSDGTPIGGRGRSIALSRPLSFSPADDPTKDIAVDASCLLIFEDDIRAITVHYIDVEGNHTHDR